MWSCVEGRRERENALEVDHPTLWRHRDWMKEIEKRMRWKFTEVYMTGKRPGSMGEGGGQRNQGVIKIQVFVIFPECSVFN